MLADMQVNGRPLGKAERQRLLAGIVARKRVGTQLELAAALASAGCPVTQATGGPIYEHATDLGKRCAFQAEAVVTTQR